jgi:hypothetical protein
VKCFTWLESLIAANEGNLSAGLRFNLKTAKASLGGELPTLAITLY